jgi:hypothetical protein
MSLAGGTAGLYAVVFLGAPNDNPNDRAHTCTRKCVYSRATPAG